MRLRAQCFFGILNLFTELSCGGSATQFTSQVPLPVPYIESVVYCNYCSKHYLIAQTTERVVSQCTPKKNAINHRSLNNEAAEWRHTDRSFIVRLHEETAWLG